jgi:DNA-directed RNA polymerase subunit RPC12/RpoP
MSIEFKCPACGNEMTAPDEMKGQRGKCPECGRLIKVPEYSSNSLVFSDKGYFKSFHLNQLFQDFLDEYDDDIKSCRVANNLGKDIEGAILEIYTGRGRTQIVVLGRGVINGDEVLISSTTIGKKEDADDFYDVLMDLALNLPAFPTYAVTIYTSDNGLKELRLNKVTRLEYVDSNVFYESVLRMAHVADIVESQHYSNDIN